MTYLPYNKYKDSNIGWLGVVPTHWKITPLFAVASERLEKNLGMQEDNLLSLSYGNIVEKNIAALDGLLPASFETYQIVYPDDIVMRLTDLQNDKRSLRSAIVKAKGIITSAYLALNPRTINAAFLSYLLRAYDLTKVFYSMGGGLRQSMKFADVKRLPILLPEPVEQALIAKFLDRETAKIDDLVADQERLIALLKEKRQAVISHAVTKGLDPDLPMKDSGIRFLRAIPKHWKLASLKNFISLSTSGPRGWSDRISDEGALFFQSQNIGLRMDVKLENAKRISVPPGIEAQRAKLSVGDVVVCITGARTGAVAHVNALDAEAYVNQHVCLLRPDQDKVYSRFLAYVLISSQVQEQLGASTYGLKQGLGLEDLRSTVVPIPENAEAVSIVEYLDSITSVLDQLVEEVDRSIRLLQERRSALISAAVTGKIDVRRLVDTEAAA